MPWLKYQDIASRTISNRWVPSIHSDPYWRIYWNQTSGAEIESSHGIISLKPDKIYILPAWLKWRGTLSGPVDHTWLNFRTLQWNKEFCRRNFPKIVHVDLYSARGTCMREIFDGFRSDGRVHSIDYEALAHLALGEFLKHFPLPQQPTPTLLKEVLDHIQNNLNEDLRVENLARIQRCSIGHLSRLFKQHLNASPAHVVRESRISLGADRLIESNDTVEKIAEDCGFSNRYHFSRVFSEIMHVSPAAFRKDHLTTST